MHDDAGQGLLIDVRGEHLADLLSMIHAHGAGTALDKILSTNFSSNGFNNYIDGNSFNNSIG
jgi:hypothetical protein